VTTTTGCSLQVTSNYIIRYIDPGVTSPTAAEIGNVDEGNCTDTLSTFQQNYGNTPGECVQIAKESDNPGYDVNGSGPAPPLKDVIMQVGDACN